MTVRQSARRLLGFLAVCVAVGAVAVWLLHRHGSHLRVPVLRLVNDLGEPASVAVQLGVEERDAQTFTLQPGESAFPTAHYDRLPSRVIVERLDARGRVVALGIVEEPMGEELPLSSLRPLLDGDW